MDKKWIRNLTNAIVRQAVHDWKFCVKHQQKGKIKCNGQTLEMRCIKRDLEEFFLGENGWFEMLTGIDGKWAYARMEEKFGKLQDDNLRGAGSERPSEVHDEGRVSESVYTGEDGTV